MHQPVANVCRVAWIVRAGGLNPNDRQSLFTYRSTLRRWSAVSADVAKQKRLRLAVEVRNVAMNRPSQLEADWIDVLLTSLSFQRDEQIIKVDVGHAQFENFANACSTVEKE